MADLDSIFNLNTPEVKEEEMAPPMATTMGEEMAETAPQIATTAPSLITPELEETQMGFPIKLEPASQQMAPSFTDFWVATTGPGNFSTPMQLNSVPMGPIINCPTPPPPPVFPDKLSAYSANQVQEVKHAASIYPDNQLETLVTDVLQDNWLSTSPLARLIDVGSSKKTKKTSKKREVTAGSEFYICKVCNRTTAAKTWRRHNRRHRYCPYHAVFHTGVTELGQCELYIGLLNTVFKIYDPSTK